MEWALIGHSEIKHILIAPRKSLWVNGLTGKNWLKELVQEI
jgi:hypothetical protein